MIDDFFEIFKLLTIIFFFLLFTIFVIVICISGVSYISCREYKELTKYNVEYEVFNGCMVFYNGIWIPKEKVNLYLIKEKK